MPTLIRKSCWSEVCDQFAGHGGNVQAQSNINGWAARYGVPDADLNKCSVWLESWSARELDDVVAEMTKVEPRVTVDMVDAINNATLPPRLEGLPATFVKFGDLYGIIDGKHRVNQWKHRPGNYAVLVIHA